MLIVFLPSLDGLRQEWYDASASLGGSSWSFWRHVGGPILAPSFLGALLLLFTNAFSAYATAAALISQGAPLITLQIGNAMQSEIVIGQENVGKALALGMIVIVCAGDGPVCPDPATRLTVGAMTCQPGVELGAAAPEGGALIARPKGAGRGRRGSRLQLSARIAVLFVVLGYLILPLFAMVEFSTRGDYGSRTLNAYAAILDDQNLIDGVTTSLQIAVLTVLGMLVLLVPTMVWTVVRVPRMRRVVEFLCLLPLAIPAIVIVVGIAPIYRWMGQNLGAVGASPLTLAFIDIILVLPFAYRAIDSSLRSIDVATLADAARSLGCQLATHDPPGDRAEHPGRRPVGLGPRDRARAG